MIHQKSIKINSSNLCFISRGNLSALGGPKNKVQKNTPWNTKNDLHPAWKRASIERVHQRPRMHLSTYRRGRSREVLFVSFHAVASLHAQVQNVKEREGQKSQ